MGCALENLMLAATANGSSMEGEHAVEAERDDFGVGSDRAERLGAEEHAG